MQKNSKTTEKKQNAHPAIRNGGENQSRGGLVTRSGGENQSRGGRVILGKNPQTSTRGQVDVANLAEELDRGMS